MKLKLLSLIPMLGLTSTAPVAAVTTSNTANVANPVTLNADKKGDILPIAGNLSVRKSINKSCDKLVEYEELNLKEITHIHSLVTIENNGYPYAKCGWNERSDLFTESNKIDKNKAYYRYKSNHVETSNSRSWGNAKKYQLNVTVPAHTTSYTVQINADCKVKNLFQYDQSLFGEENLYRTFMQGNLSKISTNPDEVLMPYMGVENDNKVYRKSDDFKTVTHDSFFLCRKAYRSWETKPYVEAKLNNIITLTNFSDTPKVVPIYFWYSFFGGGYTSHGSKSHINCSEVTFSANAISSEKIQINGKLKEVNSINKSCDKLLKYDVDIRNAKNSTHRYIKNINSLLTIEAEQHEGAEVGKIERADLFKMTDEKVTEFDAYYRYISNHVDKSNKTSYGNAKKYELSVAVPANTKQYKVEIVANCKIKLVTKPDGFCRADSFFHANLSNLSIDKDQQLLPVIGLTDNNEYCFDHTDFVSQKDDAYLFMNDYYDLGESKPYKIFKLSKTITLSNESNETKIIPVYFWYSFFGGGYSGFGGKSQINCSEVTFSANHIN